MPYHDSKRDSTATGRTSVSSTTSGHRYPVSRASRAASLERQLRDESTASEEFDFRDVDPRRMTPAKKKIFKLMSLLTCISLHWQGRGYFFKINRKVGLSRKCPFAVSQKMRMSSAMPFSIGYLLAIYPLLVSQEFWKVRLTNISSHTLPTKQHSDGNPSLSLESRKKRRRLRLFKPI